MGQTKSAAIKGGLLQAAGILVITTFLSRILGFVREQVLLSRFGLGYKADAYIAAFTIPDFLYEILVGGAIAAAFIPVFRSLLSTEGEKEAWTVASTAINVVVIVMLIGVTLGMIFTPYLIPLVAYGLSGETLELTVRLTRIMFPAVIFTALNGLMMGILQSHKKFLPPALGAIFYNIAIIGGGIFLSPFLDIAGFSVGVVIGVLGNFLIQLSALKKIGIGYKPLIDFNHPGVRKLALLMIPAIIGLSAAQINLIVNQNIASDLAAGSIATLRLANRIMVLPLAIFGASIAIAFFPTLTDKAARSQIDQYKETLSLGIRSISFLTIPSAVALMVLGVPIVRVFFQQGQFTAADTKLTASVLFFYSFALLAQGMTGVLVRGFYALQKSFIPVSISVVTILLNFTLNMLFKESLGVRGIALAFSLTAAFNVLALFFMLRRQIGALGIKRMTTSFTKIIIASLIMAVAAYFTSLGLESFLDVSSKINQILQVGTTILVAAFVYGGIAIVLKMEEANPVIGTLKRRFGKS